MNVSRILYKGEDESTHQDSCPEVVPAWTLYFEYLGEILFLTFLVVVVWAVILLILRRLLGILLLLLDLRLLVVFILVV